MYQKENLAKLKQMNELAPEVMKAFWAFDKAAVADGVIPVNTRNCTAPLNFWTGCYTLQRINTTKSPALLRSPLTAGALDRYSGERSSTVFWCGGYRIDPEGFLNPPD